MNTSYPIEITVIEGRMQKSVLVGNDPGLGDCGGGQEMRNEPSWRGGPFVPPGLAGRRFGTDLQNKVSCKYFFFIGMLV
jgi:hypothetical protein